MYGKKRKKNRKRNSEDTGAKSLAWPDSRALMVTRQESDDIVIAAVPRQVSGAGEGKKKFYLIYCRV